VILHLMPVAAWGVWRDGGTYEPASLSIEGFVHCTGDDDLMLTVANQFYAEEPGELVVVTLDEARLASEVRWEAPAHPDGGAPVSDEPVFPHVYGPLDRDAVVGVRRLRRSGGRFTGYEPTT
jgi:uncharacterized protein (DUF952 family)